MRLFPRTFLGVTALLAIYNISFARSDPPENTAFCAKPYEGDVKSRIDDNINKVAADTSGRPSIIKLWETRTITYYVDSGLSTHLIAKIKKATNILAKDASIHFIKCKGGILDEKNVPGFVYIGKFSDFCPVETEEGIKAAACSKGLGIRKKGTASGLPVTDNSPSLEKQLAKRGAPIGLNEDNTEFVILHELIHRLSFEHQHQSPYASAYFQISGNQGDQCKTAVPSYDNNWVSEYDPASIMHYQLKACKGIELDCSKGPDKYGHIPLKQCKIDDVILKGTPCFYASQRQREAVVFSDQPS